MEKLQTKNGFIVLLLLLLVSCSSSSNSFVEFSGNVMTIDYRIIVGDLFTEEQKEEVQKIIETTFIEVDQYFNKWNPYSEISHINSLEEGQRHILSPQLARLLEITQQAVILTENRFDPTIEPLQKIWKKYLEKNEEPFGKELEDILPSIGWDNLQINGCELIKANSYTALDLGGIAKGYCVDLLVERLSKLGSKNIYAEWGGEIKTRGTNSKNQPWRLFISRLGDADPKKAFAIVELENEAIATSGDYNQFWVIPMTNQRKKVFFHIIDPKFKRLLEIKEGSIASVTVVANTCALADALATAGMLFSNEKEALEWAEKIQKQIPGTKFWFQTRTVD